MSTAALQSAATQPAAATVTTTQPAATAAVGIAAAQSTDVAKD